MQRLILLGLNHTTAPLSVREKLSFTAEEGEAALGKLRQEFAGCEAVLLSTCNRVELYVVRPTHGHPRHAELAAFLAGLRGLKVEEFAGHLYEKSEREAVGHLFAVASSLDSMVVGETQILGQVRQAYEAGCRAGTVGPMLHPLFQRAVAVGKQVMTETTLAEGRVSVASVALEYAGRIFDTFSDKTVLTIGAGKMAWMLLSGLAALKPGKLLVCNRDPAKAGELAGKFSATAVGWEGLAEHLAGADIVVSSTGSSAAIITREMFEAAMKRRRYKPVFLLDVAVPRDVAVEVGKLENVYLYNLDDLQRVVEATRNHRGSAVAAASRIVEEQVRQFTLWYRAREMGPLIDQLYQRSHALAQEELARTLAKMSHVSPEERERLEELARRIVNKLLHDPIQMLREAENIHGPMLQYLHAAEKLFKLDEPEGEKEPEEKAQGEEEARPGN